MVDCESRVATHLTDNDQVPARSSHEGPASSVGSTPSKVSVSVRFLEASAATTEDGAARITTTTAAL